MKNIIFALVVCLGLLAGCSNSDHSAPKNGLQRWAANQGKIKVLSTVAMIDELVRLVGGSHVDGLTLIQGDLDPHAYQPVKGDDEKFLMADLVFYNGLGLEHGPSWQHYLSHQDKAVGIGNRLNEEYPSLILYDDAGQRDPHIWTDISLWAKTVPYIVEALSRFDPEHAEEYRANGDSLYQKMMATHEELYDKMQQIPEKQRFFVTSHDAFNYFTRAYLSTSEERLDETWHKRFAAPEGLAPDSQLSTTDIQEIIDHLRLYHVHILFPESNLSKDSIRKLVQAGKEAGLDLMIADIPLYGDAMGPPGSTGDTYLKMIEHNVDILSQYLIKNRIGDDEQTATEISGNGFTTDSKL